MQFQGWRDPEAAVAFPAPSWALPPLEGDFILRLAGRRQQSGASQSQTAMFIASRLWDMHVCCLNHSMCDPK